MPQGISALEQAFTLQKAAFAKNPNPSKEERVTRLNAFMGMMMAGRDRLKAALKEDFSCHPDLQADFMEILALVGRAQYNLSMLDEWMKPSPRDTDPVMQGNTQAYIQYQPKGVIGNMAPWNFPIVLALGPACDMLAAGNHVIIKPSDLTPATSQVMDELISEHFDESVMTVIQGELDVAKHFPTLAWDHLLYTGNPEVAKSIATSAAQNLVPLTLELGGKSPAIFAHDAINETAISNLLRVKMVKNGQMCVSPDYALVPRHKLLAFADIAREWVNTQGRDYVAGDSITGIINQRHFDRIQGMLDSARNTSAEIIQLTQDNRERRMAMSLVLNPPLDSELMRDEIFGPILPVVPYDSIEEAIDYINQNERPLGLYLYSQDENIKHQVLNHTHSGGVTINGAAFQTTVPSLGFGGSGNSGYGRYNGIEGFREFSNPRGIVEFDRDALLVNVLPPYGATAQAILDAALSAE